MKTFLKFLISYKVIKMIIGSLLAIVILSILVQNGLIEFIIKTLKNL